MNTDSRRSPEGLPESTPFERYLQRWLAQASPILAEIARLAALPHSFDLSLLSLLRGRDDDLSAITQDLVAAGLLTEVAADRFAIQSSLRGPLLRHWQDEDTDGYRRACALAAEHQRSLPSDVEQDAYEFVYFQLGADDLRGIEALTSALEQAWSRNRIGLAERLLEYAEEQKPILGSEAQDWLLFFQARQALMHLRLDQGERQLRDLLIEDTSFLLRAQVLLNLGNVLVNRQQWTEALTHYNEASALFLEIDDSINIARTLEYQGLAYLQLASNQGGLPPEWAIRPSGSFGWLYHLAHAPFLLYQAFSRRFTFLPNLYFGTDYQDWIIIRLLYAAIEYFEKAAEVLISIDTHSPPDVNDALTDIQIRLADLYHRVGEWSVAERRFRLLRASPHVQGNEHKQALLALAQGRAALARSDYGEAHRLLQDARSFFSRYEDNQTLSVIARLLGSTESLQGSTDTAVPFYAESLENALAVDDLLMATHVWTVLSGLGQRTSLSSENASRIEALNRKMDRRAYIARFPGEMLQYFRWLATYVAFPLAYLFVSVLKALARIPFTVLDVLLLERTTLALAPLADLAGGLLVFIGVVLGLLWLYEFFYGAAGWFFVRRSSLDTLLQHPPLYVLTVPEGIAVRTETGTTADISLASFASVFAKNSRNHIGHNIQGSDKNKTIFLEESWNSIVQNVAVNRSLWRTPSALFSVLLLISKRVIIVIPGIVNHYQSLYEDIRNRLQESQNYVQPQSANSSILRSRWALISLVLSILLTVVLLFDWVDTSCRDPNVILVSLRAGNYAYAIDVEGDIRVVQSVQRPNRLHTVGLFDVPGKATAIATANQYLYVADDSRKRLWVVNVSQPEKPRATASLTISGETAILTAHDHFVYVIARDGELQIVDVSDPSKPVKRGSYRSPNEIYDVDIAHNLVFIATGTGGLHIIDITNPDTLREVGHFATRGPAQAVIVDGRFAYVVGLAGLQVIDIDQPASAIEIAFSAEASGAITLKKELSHLFLAGPGAMLRVFNVNDPSTPILARTYSAPKPINELSVAIGYVFLVMKDAKLQVVDLFNPCDEILEEDVLSDLVGIQSLALLKPYPLLITSIVYEFLRWGLLVFPLIGLTQFIYTRFLERRLLRAYVHFDVTADLSLVLALLFFLYWTINKIIHLAD